MGCEDSIRADLRMLLCRKRINRGLSIVGRGQQRHRHMWMLIRKCSFYITDGEIDQLDMDDDADGYYDGEGEGDGEDSYGEEDEEVKESESESYGQRRRRRRRSRGKLRRKNSSKV